MIYGKSKTNKALLYKISNATIGGNYKLDTRHFMW